MSCTHVLCTYKTNYLTKHPRDSNNNRKEDMHEVYDGVIWPNLVSDPEADNHENVPDTDSTEDSEDEFSMCQLTRLIGQAQPALQELWIRAWVRQKSR
jgi:hypothetical protein